MRLVKVTTLDDAIEDVQAWVKDPDATLPRCTPMSPARTPAERRSPSVVREVELHAARSGWDQPAQLFALVDTAELLAARAAARRGARRRGAAAGLTPVEQETVSESLEELLADASSGRRRWRAAPWWSRR